MQIEWLGHSCFLLTSEAGTRVLMDPPDPETGYDIKPMQTDVLTMSHDHHDHAFSKLALGQPQTITDAGVHAVKDIVITGVPSWHDEKKGALRGPNMIYVAELDGIRVMHAGDLGHELDAAAIAAIGHVDVLLVPVGGVYTIDYQRALNLSNVLHPSVVIPMHYKTEHLSFQLDEIMPFLNAAKGCAIHRMGQSEATLTKDSLGSDRILVLTYPKPRKDGAEAEEV